MPKLALLVLTAVVATGLTACGTDAAPSSVGSTAAAPAASTTAGATTITEESEPASAAEAPMTSAPSDEATFADEWEQVAAPADCMCGDGSAWSYFVRTADPEKVLLFLEGGGACFSAETCATGSDTYKQDVGHGGGFQENEGIFDLDNPENPFADYSMVFIPYCTGDVHAGNTTTDYGNGVVVQHKGFVNGRTALNGLVERFPDAASIVVGGASAGSFPTPIYAGLAADLLPTADVKVLADGSGAIPDAMGLVTQNWKILESLPEWPETAGATYEQITPSWIFEITSAHNPEIDFARHDYAFDEVLADYAQLVGLTSEDLVGVMQANEAKVEATGTPVATWIAPGTDHTIVGKPALYTEELNGTRFVDWLAAFLAGRPLDDQHCTVCTG